MPLAFGFPQRNRMFKNVALWVKQLYIDGVRVGAIAAGDDLDLVGDLDVGGAVTVTESVTAADLIATDDVIVGDDLIVTGLATIGETLAVTGNLSTAGYLQSTGAAAVTATAGGGTTGLIPAGASFVVVTSDDANKQISLPAATVGHRIRILIGATGCELISAVAAHKVNDVTVGATNEAALTALNLYDCQYVATNTWVVIGYTKLGAVQAALVPDVL